MSKASDFVYQYHQTTKHRLHAYAKGPEFIDWENQPNPFRRFLGCAEVKLPLLTKENILLSEQANPVLNKETIAALLELSFGLSCWKQYGPDKWALRCNPSSGNLHPTEAYIINQNMPHLDDGLYHYAPHDHLLERRGELEVKPNAQASCYLALSSIAWREAWKYGERAYRYVQLDIGHALGALYFAAKTLGLKLQIVDVNDQKISQLIGLDRIVDFNESEVEEADVLLQISVDGDNAILANNSFSYPNVSKWYGEANTLGGSPKHHWKILDKISQSSKNEDTEYLQLQHTNNHINSTQQLKQPIILSMVKNKLAETIRQRRSAQAFVAKQSFISLEQFYSFLAVLMPNFGISNDDHFSLLPCSGLSHLVFFIHRVEELEAGLYILVRNPDSLSLLQSKMNPDFQWTAVNTKNELPLYLLKTGDMRKVARSLSCYQEIASSSSFCIAMLAEFDLALSHANHLYRQLHWEAGFIGHVLYLQAELIGKRGTGIGCFFDDEVHDLLGLKGTQLQVLYHFTVGYPVLDQRIQTLAPYSHL